jgi:hypothetical protein
MNGHFLLKDELNDYFKDFISQCLHIDPEKRKNASTLLSHALFNKIKKSKSLIDRIDKEQYFLLPTCKEILQKFGSKEELKFKIANSQDNYEIFKNILKIDVMTFLKKKGVINYRPKILNIPQYFSLYQEETDDFSFSNSEMEENSLSMQNNLMKQKKAERKQSVDLIYDKDLNEKLFSEGCIIFIGNYIINLPTDYEKDQVGLENFIKNSIYDLQLFKSEGYSLISDKSSASSSKLSVNLLTKDNTSVQSKSMETRGSQAKLVSSNLEKEISFYFRLKFLIYNIIFHLNNYKKDDLLAEIKKTGYQIPSNLRPFIYLILLEVDYFNDLEEMSLARIYESKIDIQAEMSQVRKDILRCDEYDSIFKTEEGKYQLSSIFEALLYNKEGFFYSQGMDSIAAAMIKLFYTSKCELEHSMELAYEVFYKFIKKLLFNFYILEEKTIKNLEFYHLIIQRLLAFFDPALYLYMEKINFFEDQYASNWILTLFSRTFKFDILYKIWDVLLVENINIIYLFLCFILKENRSFIMNSTKDDILKELSEISDFVKIEPFISEVVKSYKIIPQSLLPISHDFDQEALNEMKRNGKCFIKK